MHRRREPPDGRRTAYQPARAAAKAGPVGLAQQAPAGRCSSSRAQLTEYYAPKNFNIWYFFGSLALLVLVLQLVTGIFLTMFYKPGEAPRSTRSNSSCARCSAGWLHPLPAFHRRLGVLHRRLPAHVPRAAVRLVQGAARAAVAVRHADVPGADGRGLHGLRAALGQHVVLGRAGDRQPVRHHSRSSARSWWSGSAATTASPMRRSTASSRCTWRRCRWRCCCWWCCTWWRCTRPVRTIPTASRSRSKTDADGQPLDGIPFHPYYTVKDIVRRRRVPDAVRDRGVLRADLRRPVPREGRTSSRPIRCRRPSRSRRRGTSRPTTRSCAPCPTSASVRC